MPEKSTQPIYTVSFRPMLDDDADICTACFTTRENAEKFAAEVENRFGKRYSLQVSIDSDVPDSSAYLNFLAYQQQEDKTMDTHCVNLEIRRFYRIYVEAPRGSTEAEILDKARSAALEDERNLIEDEDLDLESQDILNASYAYPVLSRSTSTWGICTIPSSAWNP